MKSRYTRIALLTFGVFPATLLGLAAIFALLGAIDRIDVQPLVGILGTFWSIFGLSGAAGAWASFVFFHTQDELVERWLFWATTAGLFAASIAVAAFWGDMSKASLLLLVIPIVAGTANAMRIGGPPRKCKLVALTCVIVIPVLFRLSESAYTETQAVDANISWTCGSYGSCDRFITYRIYGQESPLPLSVEPGLIEHLSKQPNSNVQAIFEVSFVLGTATKFELVAIGGFELQIPNMGRNVPEVLLGETESNR